MADAKITALDNNTTIADDDLIVIVDDVAGTPVTEKRTWTNVKAFLKTYFDTLYAAITHTHTASQVTDFDTEVSNNTDVAANTAARHAAVTVTDSSEIDFTLTGQDITASLVAGSIDESKLDASVNASLDLADSAYQPGGTDVALADGGTGASLTDPNADRILFWDDSAGAMTWLTASTGLTISGTNMTARTASATQTGIVELATDAETVTGTDTARATTPANITAKMAAPGTIGGTTPGAITGTTITANTHVNLNAQTASRVAILDASKNIISADTATYPSLTELAYVKGVTSAIQTQLDAKAPLASPTFTGTLTGDDIVYDTATGAVNAIGNLGASETFDWGTYTHFTGTLDQNTTLDFSNAVSGMKITLALAYDGSAQRSITWTPTIKWAGGAAPDEPSASGEVLLITVAYLGTTYYGSAEIFS